MPDLSKGVAWPRLFVSADDRTGALDTGAACADAGLATVVVPHRHTGLQSTDYQAFVSAPACVVVDTTSRHVDAAESSRRVVECHREARRRAPTAVFCHKLDSTLRGHWASEVAGLVGAGYRLGIVAAYPAAGRTCVDGEVRLDGVPVAQTEFAQDPLNPVTRSHPAAILAEGGIMAPAVVVFDAETETDMRAAAAVCRTEGRVLVGTAGSIGAMARSLGPGNDWRPTPLPRPIVFVCGSLHPMSRRQIEQLRLDVISPADRPVRIDADVVITTPVLDPDRSLSTNEAEAMASRLARAAWHAVDVGARTLVTIGGDTTAAVVGDRALTVRGVWSFGMPVCEMENKDVALVAKPGSFGDGGALRRLLGDQRG